VDPFIHAHQGTEKEKKRQFFLPPFSSLLLCGFGSFVDPQKKRKDDGCREGPQGNRKINVAF